MHEAVRIVAKPWLMARRGTLSTPRKNLAISTEAADLQVNTADRADHVLVFLCGVVEVDVIDIGAEQVRRRDSEWYRELSLDRGAVPVIVADRQVDVVVEQEETSVGCDRTTTNQFGVHRLWRRARSYSKRRRRQGGHKIGNDRADP